MRHRDQTILALDPGLRDLGFAVLHGRRLLARDAISLRRVESSRRLAEAKARVAALVRTYRPTILVLEKTYRHPVPWLNDLHRLTRSCRRLATRSRAAFATYAPQQVRASVVGDGKAKKPEVALAIAHRFPSLRVYLTSDRRWKERLWQNMFDAIALALHHQSIVHSPSRSRRSG